MSDSIAEITGQVIDNASNSGLPGLTVEAWDSTNTYPQPLATGKTDANGRFMLRVNPAAAKLNQLPELYFKVLDDSGTELTSTEELITWNSLLEQDVTLYIAQADNSGVTDKFNATQLIAMTDFLGRSDFKGVVSEAAGVGQSSLGFVRDMFVNTFTNLQQPPLAVAAKRSAIVGQDTQTAMAVLQSQQISVNEVLPYTPGLNKNCLSILTSQPLSLRAGQSVNLYQQDGMVKFYSLAPGTTAQGCATTAAGSAPATSSAPATGATPAGNAATPGVAAKDEQIAQLQEQLVALRKEQDALKAFIQSKLPG